MQSATPIIFVEQIEPCLQFWFDLGFEKSMEVPTGSTLGFVGLASDGVEIMYQSRASLADDLPQFSTGAFERSGTCLYIRVGSLEPLLPVLQETDVIVPERKTFYGAREIGVRAPCGSNVIFAEFGDAATS